MDIKLDEQQAELVREILSSDLGDLRSEIAHTDNPEYKRELKERETALRRILDQLADGGVTS